MSETVKGWIGVDLDGTLAHYDKWRGETHIGAPVAEMVRRVKAWIEDGSHDVKVFTARVSSRDGDERAAVERAIHAWCEEHIGQRLEVVCAKDYAMVALYDDRATQVIPNTGITIVDALAARERELAEARADLAAVEAVGKLVQATPGAFVQKAHVGYDGLLLAVWQDETRFDVIESAPTLVALGRALLAREAGDVAR